MTTLLLSWRANTDDPKIGKKGPANDGGAWWPLDRAYPDWREFKTASVLWSYDEDANPDARIAQVVRANPEVDTIVAFGRDVSRALGLPKKADFFGWYETKVAGRDITVIPIPNPTPRNRHINSESFQRQLRFTLERLHDGERK